MGGGGGEKNKKNLKNVLFKFKNTVLIFMGRRAMFNLYLNCGTIKSS